MIQPLPFAPGTLFSRIFYASSVAMAIIALDDGRFVDVNQACAELVGYPRDELIGHTTAEFGLLDADTAARIANRLSETGRLSETAAILYPRDRSPRDAIVSIQTEDWEGKRYAIAIFQDLTRHREVEEALVAVETRFHLFFDAMPVPVIVCDNDTLRILDANQIASVQYGYSAQELRALTVVDFWPAHKRDDYLAEWRSRAWDAVASGVQQHRRRDGSAIDAQVTHYGLMLDGRRVRLVVVEDITEQMAAQAALRDSEERLGVIAEMVTDTIWDLDACTGQIGYTGGMQTVFGHPAHVHADVGWWLENIHDENRAAIQLSFQQALDSGTVWSGQYRFRKGDGKYAHVLDRGHIFRDEAGTAVRIIGAMVDLTHQMELREATTKAAMAERQRLARDLHDAVTQSLYSLTLMAEAARRRAQLGDEQATTEYVHRLSQLSRQSLNEMHLLVYELRPAALEHDGLVGALEKRLTAIERRAGIEARLESNIVRELTPELQTQLFRVAEEALNNSLRHADATSLAIFIHSDDHRAVLEVRDDGCGFDVQAVVNSAGLGLVSMRERVDNLGGVFEVNSRPGGGTLVRVTLEQWDGKNGKTDQNPNLR